MEKIRLSDRWVIELPKNIRDKFGLEKGMEFNLYFDSDIIYLKRVFKSLKEKSFREVASAFREMAKKEKLRDVDVTEEIRRYRRKGM